MEGMSSEVGGDQESANVVEILHQTSGTRTYGIQNIFVHKTYPDETIAFNLRLLLLKPLT